MTNRDFTPALDDIRFVFDLIGYDQGRKTVAATKRTIEEFSDTVTFMAKGCTRTILKHKAYDDVVFKVAHSDWDEKVNGNKNSNWREQQVWELADSSLRRELGQIFHMTDDSQILTMEHVRGPTVETFSEKYVQRTYGSEKDLDTYLELSTKVYTEVNQRLSRIEKSIVKLPIFIPNCCMDLHEGNAIVTSGTEPHSMTMKAIDYGGAYAVLI